MTSTGIFFHGETEVWTSFGPMGRSKVISNPVAGSLVITKDGQQLLQCLLSNPELQDPLERILISMCCNVTKEYGDGSMSALIIMRMMSRSLGASKLSQHRLHFLHALEVIIHAVEMNKSLITQHMVDHSVWRSTDTAGDLSKDFSDHIKGLWVSILLPATNSATASNIATLLVSFSTSMNRLYFKFMECDSGYDLLLSIHTVPL